MANRFLVLVRADSQEWTLLASTNELGMAVGLCNQATTARTDMGGQALERFDRAQVIELGGRDAVSSFSYRYGVKT